MAIQERVIDYISHHPAFKVLTGKELVLLQNGYVDGYQDAMLDLLDKLAAWMKHAERGAKDGSHLYHLGQIALILALKDWAKAAIEDYEQCKTIEK